MFSRCKKLAAAGFFAFTLWSVLATSGFRDDDHPENGSFYIISDCVTPTAENNVIITNNVITSPGGVNLTDFGFPQNTLSQTMTGTVGAATRECTVTYGESGHNYVDNRWLYSCFDNGTFKCSIYIE